MKRIDKKMMIGEAISINPKVADILIERGIHCVGCSGMSFETLEQGLKLHGMTNKEVDKLIKSINKPKIVSITKTAKSKIINLFRKKYMYLRIKEDHGKYRLLLEKKKSGYDKEVVENGIKIIFSKKDSKKINNLVIDYSDAAGGFIVR